ncbi:hypothetical protein [Planctomicrobium sp. SH527]|uniref:hypothetical protein n=1 Tax=Planctomicrobium sp. SH527 TaxID=3448123 RepID=UPI003F5B34AC
MPTETSKPIPLSGRDRQVLEHVARYRMTTTTTLQQSLFPKLSTNAVGKIANRLCRAGLLAKYPLTHPAPYFVLGSQGANVLGLGSHRTTPIGPQALPIDYAVLLYCVLGQQPRHRLLSRELAELCPWLPPPMTAVPHCLDPNQRVLELVRVDLGGPADHVARRAVQEIAARRRLPEFLAMLTEGRFRLVVITATKNKSQALRAALQQHDWPVGMQVHFSVVPQLLRFIVRTPH